MRNSLYLPAATLACLVSAPAWADCTSIETPNYTIRSPGSYCLARNLAVPTGNGIAIVADKVDLDCGDHTIDGSSQAKSTTGRGIVGYGRTGVVVRNCTTKGFIEGVRLTGTGNHIRDNVMITPYSRGITVDGLENIVEGNHVFSAGGTTVASWGAFGINVSGSAIIRDNIVSGVAPTVGSNLSGYGIYVSGDDAGVVEGNVIRNVNSDGGRIAMGLTVYSSANAVLKENFLVNPSGTYGYALFCSGSGNASVDNVTEGFRYGVSPSCAVVSPE
jgi:hypothetical protein